MAGKEATKGGTLCTTTFEGRENRVIFERWGETNRMRKAKVAGKVEMMIRTDKRLFYLKT